MKISIVQTDIIWENKQENLRLLREKLLPLRGTTEIVFLPEMFTTGFSMNSRLLAEPVSGTTLRSLKNYAVEFHLSLAGSFICEEQGSYYNRAFLITPDGQEFYYDKRHLFRMGHEAEHFSAGSRKVIIPYNGWNICLQVCYDLRFPVWSRNVNNEYDLLIYVASWPTPRIQAWNTLLCARAIENQCYVCGVNRIGQDGNGLCYPGYSALYGPKGENLAGTPDSEEKIQTIELSLEALTTFRHKFPCWKDADPFLLY